MSITFEQLIAHNKRQSFFLILGLISFTAIIFGSFGIALSSVDASDFLFPFLIGASIGGILASVGAILSFYLGPYIITGISGARKVHYSTDPILFNVVEEMAIAAGIPTPSIYAIYDESANAFASGRDPEHALIGITTGLRKKLTRDELQAVIAHEIAHIKNFDIRLMMLVGVFAGLIVLASDFFARHFLDTIKFRGTRKSYHGKKNPAFFVIAAIISLVLAWLAPLTARLLQLAVSREREFLADATAIKFCRNPTALISALKKISKDPEHLECDNRALEHLFVINPDPKQRLSNLHKDSIWSTHPPLIKRISRLNKLAKLYPQIPEEKTKQTPEKYTFNPEAFESIDL
ncbi:MAG: M48 family metallopeptidase [Bdellovibrionales bacterium]|nr:M48 family metallopeptidase [Bdellovibrionales bacterium]